ncbi:MAG: hypothetical protein KAH18_07175 [Psychromonas sp.]|nr:hypothetical protein [Psychromonas sp.]
MGPIFPTITLTEPNGQTIILHLNHIPFFWRDTIRMTNRTTHRAITSKGRVVYVWKPHPKDLPDERFICHGHSLGTYYQYGYSVCSGWNALKALEDDYIEIGAEQSLTDAIKQVACGDIVSFSDRLGKVEHSALVVSYPEQIQGLTTDNFMRQILIWSKNGTFAITIHQLMSTWRLYSSSKMKCEKIRFWRPQVHA